MKVIHFKKMINNKAVLNDISFSLKKGEIVGLIGRNGAGKTTLFRTITNFYKKDSGDCLIDNQSIYQSPALKESIFYLDEKNNFLEHHTPATIKQYYQELYSTFDSEKYTSLLKKYDLDISFIIGKNSKGVQALYKLILAFSCQASYYILDEPFDGLDLIIRKKVISLILNEVTINQCGILISSHNLLELEHIIDRAIVLQDGEIKKSFNLHEIRDNVKKIQMVFKKKNVPSIVKDNCQIIQVNGRVIIGIFENLTDELYESILEKDPVLFEEVPLTLEDLFSSQFTSESDYQLFN
ncbi:MAG: ABC transporter ATP-binding protein [Vagococcus sp.]|uniref:ABC transporter ATP-binding protein n=1 Tax=Vagococcus sp. TaxID=1933889 RepID=UPI002FCC8A8D